MSFEMRPRTEAGARLLDAIAALVPTLQSRSEDADRRNEICLENYRDIQRTGIASAFVPELLGGIGLQSMHDWVLAIAALARGDGSTAIAMSMHFSATRGMAARYATLDPHSSGGQRLAQLLGDIAAGKMLICSTTTESGTDNLHPLTEAVPTDSGWEISGTKFFVTMSSIATHVAMNVRTRDNNGDHIANVLVPMATPGITPRDDWDALGMRASGSQSVEFRGCQVPAEALRIIGPWGGWSIPVLVNRTLANVPLVGAFLGIAEAAYELALKSLSARPSCSDGQRVRSGVQHMVAEMEIALATCQCMMTGIGVRLDEFMGSSQAPTWEQGHELMKDYQSVKWVVNRHAIEIVSKAMDLAGGGGFLARNPLARLYRDVRAGPFMQPYSPVDAREYVGQVALAQYPNE